MPGPRLRHALVRISAAVAVGTAAVGTAGCGSTVTGSAAQAATSARPVVDAAAPAGRHCPSAGTLRAALPRDGAGGTYTLQGPVLCSGDWAVADPLFTAAGPEGDGQPVSVTQLFHRIGDGWQPVDRVPLCAGGTVPAAIYQLTCESN